MHAQDGAVEAMRQPLRQLLRPHTEQLNADPQLDIHEIVEAGHPIAGL